MLTRYRVRFLALLVLFSLLPIPVVAWAAPWGWSPAGAIGDTRYDHTATVLPDGAVLIVGGQVVRSDPQQAMRSSVAVFTPPGPGDDGSWRSMPPMRVARAGHTATLLPNGLVLVVGGGGGNTTVLQSSELLDTGELVWRSGPDLRTSRQGHTATLLTDGTVLVAGGRDTAGTLASAERYDPVTDRWSVTGDMHSGRKGHTAILLANGRVLVVGGYGGSGPLASAEEYDPTSGVWRAVGSLGTARWQHIAVPLVDGSVLVAGGSGPDGVVASAEIYTPATATWHATEGMTRPRGDAAAARLANGQVLVTGGVAELFSNRDATASAELYDPLSGQWRDAGRMGSMRGGHTATLRPDGTVIVAGGYQFLFFGAGPSCNCPATTDLFTAPPFSDLSPADPAYPAVEQLAARGIVRGYADGRFGPTDTTLRAQMAALIVRAMGWGGEAPANPFADRSGVDDELWRAVAILAAHDVARGYDDGTYGPVDDVRNAQAISFITRAMVQRGYWQYQPDNGVYPDIPIESGHRIDFATYVYYVGAIPDFAETGAAFPYWDRAATREWCARALWQALDGTTR